MPGDEDRVYALRAEHEANCPYRSSGSGASSGSGYTQRWTKQDQWEYEQALLAEQERQRQEAERKRKEKIKQEAANRAEQQARKRAWEQKKAGIASMLKGAAPALNEELKSAAGPAVILTPRGVKFSENELITGDEKKEAVRTQVINPSVQMAASDSQTENMRRAFWLYQKAAMAATPQEAAFLIQQADEAAQGHALQVAVPGGAELPPVTPDNLEKLKSVQTEIAEQRIKVEMIQRQKLGAEDKKNLYQRRVTDLENQLKEVRAKKEQAATQVPAAAPDKTEDLSKAPAAQADVKPAEIPPEEKKDPAEEDLLAQLMEAQKQMQSADKDLNDLLASQSEIQKKISVVSQTAKT